ncbi:C2H2 type zinc finger domain-containing protein [Nannizzia gypsea CBS 118893]|uniref:C2H2 type zinc finger domain-containing protein n=1 Tax=Arthroderma gypseum (strain ATCC MYA-4604 / CBS 118893) TaxID=535722 RepID=E4V5Y5_ARTGP|nr:C2H2 type zinc finger domain-containing protein [Nannizzia gypsea CBS 118893]EFR05510.1 C2H2 type zinc finger domain-containing protein [Nannizzia gypsea CBS 118893]
MPPRGFTNPAPKTESARTALNAFTCTLCNKSYSRHPEYEAHIGSYDHQHKKRLRDLKQLSRDPNAAEKARKAERKANEEAGLIVVDSSGDRSSAAGTGSSSTGGFKKGGFKSSFSVVAGGGSGSSSTVTFAGAARRKKNVLGDEDEDEDATQGENVSNKTSGPKANVGKDGGHLQVNEEVESDTDEEYGNDDIQSGGGYYDPRRPTGCFHECPGAKVSVS